MARILIVDDERLIAMMAQEWLEELGHEVVGPAHDLSSALALAETELDGALLDVLLGAEASYPIAARLLQRGVPVAFATGQAPEDLPAEFEKAPKLPKPFGFESFRKVIEDLVGGGRP
jgi:CheY-like chemotaxis protein